MGLDGILNEAIKAVLKAVAILLANAATICLLKSNLLEYYKDTTTVVLQKVNKKDYFLLCYGPYKLDSIDTQKGVSTT